MSENRRSMWHELKQRKVVQVGGIYAAASWVVLEVATTVTPLLDLPDWTGTLVLVLLALGLPITLVLAWAFEVTSDGVQRTEPLETSAGHRSRLPVIGVIVVGIVPILVVAFLLPDRSDNEAGGSELDPEAAVIVPFGYSGPDDLDYLGEGVFQLLAARLSGDVGPRAADPTATAAVWSQMEAADAISAPENTARRLGAARFVTGSVVASPAGLDVSATIHDLTSGEKISAQAQGSADSLSFVVDRLAAGLLSLSVGELPESLEYLTSASPEALREYLIGQREFRSGRFFVAVDHFRRAVQIDSTFALASLMLSNASNNVPGGAPGALDRAWRHRDKLGEAERVYLRARLGPGYPDPATRRERVQAYEEALALAPDRSFIWYFIGENYFHRPTSHAQQDQNRTYFERALELDPRNSLAQNHLYMVDLVRGDSAAIEDDIAQQITVDTSRASVLTGRYTLARLHRDSATSFALRDSISDRENLQWWHEPILKQTDWAARLDLDVFEDWRSGIASGSPLVEYRQAFHSDLMFGRPERTVSMLQEWERGSGKHFEPRLMLFAGAFGEIPDNLVAPVAERASTALAGLEPAELTPGQYHDLIALTLWEASLGNPAVVRENISTLRTAASSNVHARALLLNAFALALEAKLSVESGQDEGVAEMLREAVAMVDEGPSVSTDGHNALLLMIASSYEDIGDPAAALAVLERQSVWQFYIPFFARFIRERGRLAALTGDNARAVANYEYFLRLHIDAEPSVQPTVREVSEALAALRGS